MRLFVALSLTKELISGINDLVSEISGRITGVKWVKPENQHVTLVFLGNHSEDSLDNIKEALSEGVSGSSKFEVAVSGLGLFPDKGWPKVVWAGLKDEAGRLARLAGDIRKSLETRKIEYDAKEFRPHLTIARIQDISPRVKDMLVRDAVKFENRNFGVLPVDSVKLYSSVLSKAGPSYHLQKEQEIG